MTKFEKIGELEENYTKFISELMKLLRINTWPKSEWLAVFQRNVIDEEKFIQHQHKDLIIFINYKKSTMEYAFHFLGMASKQIKEIEKTVVVPLQANSFEVRYG